MRLSCLLLVLLAASACVSSRTTAGFVDPCEGSNPSACARFAAAVREAAPGQPAVAQQVVRACLAGDVEACHLHARTLMRNGEDREEAQRGFQLARRLCEEGHTPACLTAGRARGLCELPSDCTALLERACEAGEGAACALLAWDGAEGARKTTLLEQACAAARPDGHACLSLGSWYRRRAPSDPERARVEPLLERGCSLGEPAACFELALLSRESPAGAERAASLLARACAAGEEAACGEALLEPCRAGRPEACRRLGAVKVQDEQALARRLQALETACALEVAEACAARARLGGGGWAQACELGDARACVQAAGDVREAQSGGRYVEDWRERGLALLERGCAAEHPARAGACEELARWLLDSPREDDAARAVELLSRDCQAGHAESCQSLGEVWWRGKGVERNRRAALRASARHCALKPEDCESYLVQFRARSQQCEEGGARACLELGQLLDPGEEPLKAEDQAELVRAYQRACELGEAEGCRALARVHLEGRGQDRSLATLVEASERACKLGDVEGCAQAKRYAALQAGCKAGRPEPCQQLADLLLTPPSSEADRARGVELLERPCRGGEARACVRLAELFLSDKAGFVPELQRALPYLELARKAGSTDDLTSLPERLRTARARCDAGEAPACDTLAGHYLEALWNSRAPAASRSPDWAHAKAALEKACATGDAALCMKLASVLLAGPRSVEDPAAGMALLETHCAGAADACAPLLEDLARGVLPRPSLPRTLGLLQKACEGGMGQACFLLGTAQEEGRLGLTPDAPRAVETYRKACEAGSESACWRLQ